MPKPDRTTATKSDFALALADLFECWCEARSEDAGRYEAQFAKLCGVTVVTLRRWMQDMRPQRDMWVQADAKLRKAGLDPGVLDALKALRDAWTAPRAVEAATPLPGPAREAAPKPDRTPPGPAKSHASRKLLFPRLLDFGVHEVPQGSTPAQFELLAYADGGRMRIPETCFEVEVTELLITYAETDCQPIAKREAQPGLSIDGAGWRLRAPPGEALSGRRLSDAEALMTLRGKADALPSVRLRVLCEDEFALRLSPRVGEAPPSEELLKVAQRWFQKLARETDGTVSLAEAELVWKAADPCD